VPARRAHQEPAAVQHPQRQRDAIDWALRMAKGMGSEVVAVFAIAPPIYFDTSYMAPMPPPQFDPEWRDAMKKEFEEQWCKGLQDAGVRYRTVMEDGRPASVIAQVADKVPT
jgi:nucleotide-binding universal stress UspA family protein